MSEERELEVEIESLFEAGVRQQSAHSHAGRAKGYHVSGLSYDCLRNIQYSVLAQQKESSNLEEGGDMDIEGLWRTWIGTQLHLTPISFKHEWPLYYTVDVNGVKAQVHGHIDEILEASDGQEVIIDKKFVATVPRKPNSHHITQVGAYAGIYHKQTGATVKYGALLYFCPTVKRWDGQERMRVFVFPIDPVAALAELEAKVRAVQTATDAGEVIARKTGWLCDYCRYRVACEKESGPVSGQHSLDEQGAEK